MRVFVTGHQGYIGVHLVDLLKRAAYGVTGTDLWREWLRAIHSTRLVWLLA